MFLLLFLNTSSSGVSIVGFVQANVSCNYGHNILRFFDVCIFYSPQVKQSVIISNKHGIYESIHDFSIVEKRVEQISEKIQNIIACHYSEL